MDSWWAFPKLSSVSRSWLCVAHRVQDRQEAAKREFLQRQREAMRNRERVGASAGPRPEQLPAASPHVASRTLLPPSPCRYTAPLTACRSNNSNPL